MQIPILMYHAVEPRRSVLTTPPEVFRWQMGWLFERGFRVLPLGELVGRLRDGAPLPDRSVVITFDDGFESLERNAFPVLRRYGFPATVFLVAGRCGETNNWPGQPPGIPSLPLLSWEQVRRWDGGGIEFGSHTITHPRLDQLEAGALEGEITGSKAMIEDCLGHEITLLSYPYGRWNRAAKEAARRQYAGACVAQLGLARAGNDPFELERVDTYYLQNPLLFKSLGSAFLPIYLGQRKTLRKVASTLLRRAWA
jgi:peptidoglycan/xylan/chitin deacetylase (PgdA/CDA1 family)